MADENDERAKRERPSEDRISGIAVFDEGELFAERFRIEGVLGKGGMGAVYEAVDLADGARIALKVLKRKLALDGEAQQRFRREAEILASINHPGIVQIRGFGQAKDGRPWIAMEKLVGETLRQRVERAGHLNPTELAAILAAAAAPLTEAHAMGIVHRDLKPDNIFLLDAGPTPVKILDFGLSTSLTSKKLTATGTILGTPRYMSPEQIASASSSSGPTDVYALGVIVYEALTGLSPFAASDHGQLLGAILTGRVEPLSKVRDDIGEELERVVLRAMARSTDERYRTPSEFARAFSAQARSAPRAASMPRRPQFMRPPGGPEEAPMNTGLRLLVGLAGLVALAAVGLASYVWLN